MINMNYFKERSQLMEGFTNGYSIDEYKKGETVYFWHSDVPTNELEIKSGKIVQIIKAKNAAGADRIRQIVVRTNKFEQVFGTASMIVHHMFKKDSTEESSLKEDKITVDGNYEIKWIEKAMGLKNPIVKEHIENGWTFVEKVWNSEKNMYLSKVAKEVV